MHYEVTFTGTDTEKLDQAWKQTKSYLGEKYMEKMAVLREEQQTIGNPKRAEQVAAMIGMFWGISGYYPITAVEQFLLGTRTR